MVALPRQLIGRALHPPVGDVRFWLVQALVLAIAAGHELADVNNFLSPIGVPSFVTVSLFLVPIVYAALNFGLPGSLATAAWVTLLTLPDFYIIERAQHHWIDGTQLAIIDAVAVFVGQRVERERLARRRAEDSGEAYRKAQARYQALFRDSPAPIIVVSPDGAVRESNPAAQRFLKSPGPGRPIEDLLGVRYGRLCEKSPDLLTLTDPTGQVHQVRPLCTPLETEEGAMVQVLLQDVTEEQRERDRMATYAAHVVEVQEEERRRIGQELHDQPLQSLIQIYRRLASGDSPGSDLGDPGGPLATVIDDLRELAHGLRPPSLDDLGVVPALRRLVDDFAERNALSVELAVSGQIRRVNPELELSLFRIAQAALHNVERHAAARNVRVRLGLAANTATIEVEDDGIGFEVAEARRGPRSLGLLGMSERAELLGGKLAIRSSPDAGTSVRAELPLPDAPLDSEALG